MHKIQRMKRKRSLTRSPPRMHEIAGFIHTSISSNYFEAKRTKAISPFTTTPSVQFIDIKAR